MPLLKYYDTTTSQWLPILAGAKGETGDTGAVGPQGPAGLGILPTGSITQFAGATAPAQFLLCQGQSVSTTTYADLFSVIGYTYGGTGASFTIPNLQNRVPVGKGPDAEFDTLGETGGAKTHTLTSAEMPSHTHTGTTGNQSAQHSHTGTTDSAGAHSHYVNNIRTTGSGTGAFAESWGGGSGNRDVRTDTQGAHTHTFTTALSTGNHTHGFTTNATGDGSAHNNLQPYIVLNYIIKT
jgi:microcystin-dependent protein